MKDLLLGIAYRGWVAESHHRGRLCITAPDGTVRLLIGDADAPTLPRSALKPFQVIAMLHQGLDLSDELLALAGASHWGEPMHVDGVLRILAGAGLSVDDFVHTADLPLDEAARNEWLRAGRGREPLAHNCSGKHAAMLRTCLTAGWTMEDYRNPEHPLQLAVREVLEDYCGIVGDPVVDGCTAPAFVTTLPGLARSFGCWAAESKGAGKLVADAYRSYPEHTSGTADPVVRIHRQIPGAVAKVGADGILAVGLPDGTGVALKLSDGMGRGRFEVMDAVLRALGHEVDSGRDEVRIAPDMLERLADLPD